MPNPKFTAQDHRFAHGLAISLDDPPLNAPEAAEQRFDQLLKAYEHMELECAQAHRDARNAIATRDQARRQMNALAVFAVGLLLGWGFTLWLDGRLIP